MIECLSTKPKNSFNKKWTAFVIKYFYFVTRDEM